MMMRQRRAQIRSRRIHFFLDDVCVVVVFVCVAFVLCFWSSKTHTILGREKEKERINPTQTLNPKKHTKTHVKKERRKRFWKEKKIRALALARIIVLS